MKNFVITIGRQAGSGGREIAEKLSRRLGIPCYDREALMGQAQRNGDYEEVQSFYEEQPVNSLLYAIAVENFEQEVGEKPFARIRAVCAGKPCILLGRCGNRIFRGDPDSVRIFLCGDAEKRAQRLAGRFRISMKEAKNAVRDTDKARESFHRYYAREEWGRAERYDLCMDSIALGVDGTAELIMDYLRIRGFL